MDFVAVNKKELPEFMPKTANHSHQSRLYYSRDLYLDSQINGSGSTLVSDSDVTFK